MAPRAAPPSGSTPPQIVRAAINETNDGWDEHKNRVQRFNRAYDIYRGNVTPSRTQKAWQSRLYVKFGMQIVDQAMVNLIQGSPRPQCRPRRQDDQLAARAMEVLLGYYADQDHLAEKEALVIQQALIYGVSPAKNSWYYKESTIPTREGPQRVVECDRPCFTPWNAYDCWWDPAARDVDSASYIVLRDYLSKEELLRRRYDEDHGTGAYRNLDLLFRAGPGEKPSPTAQNELMQQPSNPYKDKFEILEIWRDNTLTVIGNRQILLSHGPKPFSLPGKPIVISNSRPDMFKVEGISETELVDHLQQALHTVMNLRLDNWKFTVMRGASYREGGVTDPDKLVMRPSFLWPVTDHDDVKFHDQPPLPPEAYREEDELINKLQYVTGITPYVTGTTGGEQRTATGVSLLQESASKLLTFKANTIRQQIWQRTFEQWADLTKQFLTEEMAIAIEGPGSQKTWLDVGPQEIAGDYDVRILAGEESLNRQQERAEAVAVLNAFAPYANAGLVNLQPLLEMVAHAYDLPDVRSLFPAMQQQQQQAAPQQQMQAAPQQFQIGQGIAPQPAQAILNGHAR